MSGKLAIVFPGQGCQFVGMGRDLWEAYPQVRELYAQADDLLGIGLTELCHSGPEEALTDTANTQPAIFVTSLALWYLVEPRLPIVPNGVGAFAGHSLGEYSALTAAGALTFSDGLRLVRRRGEAMRDAGIDEPGGMAAIIGLDDEVVEELVAEVSGDDADAVWPANYNSPGQVIIAGALGALDRAMALAKERGAKRALPLNVSVACHTPLMAAAGQRLGRALEETSFRQPLAPVVCNATAQPTTDATAIKAALMRQLSSPVRWTDSVRRMASDGVGSLLELGPKSVLAGLIRRIDRSLTTATVTDADALESLDPHSLL